MITHLTAFTANLSDPPRLVDPISTWSLIGHSVILVMGLVIAAGAGAVQQSSNRGAALFTLSGFALMWMSETRFLRAIHPHSVWIFRGTVLGLLVLTLAVALFGYSALRSSAVAGATVGAGLCALILAALADHFYEYLASVPLAVGTLLAIAAIIVVAVKDRP